MLHGPFNHVNDIILDGVNADLVRRCVIRTKGSPEPSGLDADFWSEVLCNSTFPNASDDHLVLQIHVVFADNLTGVGKTHELIESRKNALHYGPYLGHYVKGSKSWLIMNEGYTEIENETFQDYNTRITTDGHRHLGAIVGSNKNKKEFLIAKVCKWVK